MVADLCNMEDSDDIFPAKNEKHQIGIYIKTEQGGSNFWTEPELVKYYARKYNDVKRWVF